MNNKRQKIITVLILIFVFVFSFIYNYRDNINMDILWNYGFSHNVADGLVVYKDFNMVITPLYPLLIGGLLAIVGDSLIVFYLINSLIITGIIYIVFKLNKILMLPMFALVMYVSQPNYNLLCIFFLFLLILLEKNKKSDLVIGLVAGLCFLTKQSIGGMLFLPSLFIGNYKRIIKRIVGFIIPNAIVVIYLLFAGALKSYINYAFLGLFDFANDNGKITVYFGLTILLIIVLIIMYIKKKDISILYIIFFQIMTYPLFNAYHFMYASIPITYYIVSLVNIKQNIINKYICIGLSIFLIMPVIKLENMYHKEEMVVYENNKFLEKKKIFKTYATAIDSAQVIVNNYQKENNIYFINGASYLYKLAFDMEINKYDLWNYGNLGYNGIENYINDIKKLPNNSIFVLYTEPVKGQYTIEIDEFIQEEYRLIEQGTIFTVYRKK